MTTRRTVDGLSAAAEVEVVVVEATVSHAARRPSPDQPPGLWLAARLALGLAETVGDTVAVAVERRKHPAPVGWNVAVGAGLVAGAGVAAVGRLAARAVRPVSTVILHPPLVPAGWHPARGVEALARLGGQERAAARQDFDQAVAAVVPVVVERVLERMSLTELVTKNVDLDAIAQQIDIDAIIARMDLVGLADEVIEGIDLPEIIRASTGTVASEVVRGVRMQSIDADEAVARVVDRLFFRRRRRATNAPGDPMSLDEVDGVDLTAPRAGDGARPQAPA